ncbi:hypothetical protein [Zavarzinella formosa]|uniref:hypothetical protein n=1 Tax=Zavarzinella formosa TaxID=360055 RepID=UPI000303EC32|nr:hypothetical protein [Zavarzinella formosa]
MKKPESKRLQLLRRIIAEPDDALNRDKHLTATNRREAISAVLTPDDGQKQETEEVRFVRRLEKLMELRALNQVGPARLLSIPQSNVNAMLANPKKPRRPTLRKLPEALGMLETDLWPVETERGSFDRGRDEPAGSPARDIRENDRLPTDSVAFSNQPCPVNVQALVSSRS